MRIIISNTIALDLYVFKKKMTNQFSHRFMERIMKHKLLVLAIVFIFVLGIVFISVECVYNMHESIWLVGLMLIIISILLTNWLK